MTYERFLQLQKRDIEERAGRRLPAMSDENDPDHWIYPMPTVAEIVAAGYQADYHEKVTLERAELVKRFREDPEWRAEQVKAMRDALARGGR